MLLKQELTNLRNENQVFRNYKDLHWIPNEDDLMAKAFPDMKNDDGAANKDNEDDDSDLSDDDDSSMEPTGDKDKKTR